VAADPARRVAADVLLAVDADGAYANLLLPRLLRDRSISTRDAAFATEICYGSLRWQGVLDEVTAAASGRDVAALDPPVRAVVRIGAYQLLRMRTPAHAAVHATVEVARAICGPKPIGLVNALLRKVGAHEWDEWVRRLAPSDELGRAAFVHGFPRWVVAALAASLGDSGELDAALSEDRPVTHLVARPGRISRADLLAQAGEGATPGPWSPYAVRMAGGDPSSLPAVRAGLAAVQDEGSQLVALAAADAPVDVDAGRWLDLCAGPGGKSALLEALLPARDSAVLLCAEVQPHRAALVAGAVGPRARVLVADARQPAWGAAQFDRVIVDAPCTGLGALRRRPEVRWRRRPEDVPRLAGLQRELLNRAVDALRPGGLVAYVTCSPHLEETRAVVAAVAEGRSDLARVDARAWLPGVEALGEGPDVQLWPHRHGTDAMYLALLRKSDGVPA